MIISIFKSQKKFLFSTQMCVVVEGGGGGGGGGVWDLTPSLLCIFWNQFLSKCKWEIENNKSLILLCYLSSFI